MRGASLTPRRSPHCFLSFCKPLLPDAAEVLLPLLPTEVLLQRCSCHSAVSTGCPTWQRSLLLSLCRAPSSGSSSGAPTALASSSTAAGSVDFRLEVYEDVGEVPPLKRYHSSVSTGRSLIHDHIPRLHKYVMLLACAGRGAGADGKMGRGIEWRGMRTGKG